MYLIKLQVASPKNPRYHEYGYQSIWGEALNSTVIRHPQDATSLEGPLYVSPSVNDKEGGPVNFFEGIGKVAFERLLWIAEHKGPKYWVDYPRKEGFVLRRVGQNSSDPRLTQETAAFITENLPKEVARWEDLGFESAIVGDSHSLSFSTKGQAIFRKDSSTLYGALGGKIHQYMERVPNEVKEVTLCFGSVDIRHHLMRQVDPRESLKSLVRSYSEFVRSDSRIVSVCAPVPVEFEGRQLPKTGLYKDAPFFGSREERLALTLEFIELLQRAKIDVVTPPEEWYSMDPEQYAKEVMEVPKSVHISFPFYRRNNWGKVYQEP